MSSSHSKRIPIGGKMNDAGYPFRGAYRMDDAVNHGHSGVKKSSSTSLELRVSGANLVIERLHAPTDVSLSCELAVNGGLPRVVSLDGTGGAGLAVPGDGRDYHLTALVRTDRGRHRCRMVFNGSEGHSSVRLRAPTAGSPDVVQLYVDGKRVRPVGGWFTLPLRAAECSLVLDLPDALSHPSLPTAHGRGGSPASVALPGLPSLTRGVPHGGVGETAGGAADGLFILETVPGTGPTLQLQCMRTGQTIPLRENAAAAVPGGAGPYRLYLPAPPPPPVAAAPLPLSQPVPAPAPVGPPGMPTAVPVLPPPPPLLAGGTGPAPTIPVSRPTVELEARPHAGPGGALAFTVSATAGGLAGSGGGPQVPLEVRLRAENGAAAAGRGHATLTLPHRRAQQLFVEVVAVDSGEVVLRQRMHLPTHEAATVEVGLHEEPGTGALLVRGAEGSHVTAGEPSTGAAAPWTGTGGGPTARVETARGPCTVTVEQPNADGTLSRAVLRLAARPVASAAPPLPTTSVSPFMPVPVPTGSTAGVGAGDPAGALLAWLTSLALALREPQVEAAQRALAVLVPPSAPAATVTDYVREQLRRPVASFELRATASGLTGVRCAGHEVSAAVAGAAAAVPVIPGGTVHVPPGSNVTLTATRLGSTATAAVLNIANDAGPAAAAAAGAPLGMPVAGPWLTPSSATGVVGAASAAEEALVARLVECLQRHGGVAARVAEELAAIPASTLSPGGQRLVPLLVHCLRSAGAPARSMMAASTGAADDILVTCGNGFLENVYTAQPHWQLTASIDGQPAVPIPQHSRLPLPTASSAPSGGAGGSAGLTAFPPGGAPHFVELTARDPLTGEVRRQLRMTVLGAAEVAPVRYASGPPAPAVASVTETSPAGGVAHHPTTAAVPPASSAASTAGHVPYLDVSLTPVGEDVQVRCAARGGYRVVCAVDGLGGESGLTDVVTRVPASRQHKLELSVLDGHGRVAFQQRLDVPAMGSAAWGVALQDGGLSLDPDGSCVATVSVDRAPERAVQGNYISLDTRTPHFLILRRYLNGVHGVQAGELGLRVPAFLSDGDLQTLARLYRAYGSGQLEDDGLRQELLALRSQTSTQATRELVDALLAVLKPRHMYDEGADSGGALTPTNGAAAGAQRGSTARVYFRLTGSD